MAEWIGFGRPLKLVNVGLISYVELREKGATIFLLNGKRVEVPNEHVGDLAASLQRAGATGLKTTGIGWIESGEPDDGEGSPNRQ